MVDSENINKENMSREVDKIEAILGDSIKDKHSNKLIGAAEELENAKKIIHRIISERSQS